MAGRVVTGTAEAHIGTEDDVTEVVEHLSTRPVDAKAYGVIRLADGSIDPDSVKPSLSGRVLVHVHLD